MTIGTSRLTSETRAEAALTFRPTEYSQDTMCPFVVGMRPCGSETCRWWMASQTSAIGWTTGSPRPSSQTSAIGWTRRGSGVSDRVPCCPPSQVTYLQLTSLGAREAAVGLKPCRGRREGGAVRGSEEGGAAVGLKPYREEGGRGNAGRSGGKREGRCAARKQTSPSGAKSPHREESSLPFMASDALVFARKACPLSFPGSDTLCPYPGSCSWRCAPRSWAHPCRDPH